MRPLICLVTDRRRLGSYWGASEEDRLLRQMAAAAAAGVNLIELRERDLDARRLLRLAVEAVRVTRQTTACVVVNDRVDVAQVAGAAGVHLRSDSVAAGRVRAVTPAGFLVGRSIHRPAEVIANDGLDYLMLGAVFGTTSKAPDYETLGLEGLRAAIRLARQPVIAIGGMTPDRMADVAGTGAAGIAAIGMFAGPFAAAPSPERAMQALVAHIRLCFS